LQTLDLLSSRHQKTLDRFNSRDQSQPPVIGEVIQAADSLTALNVYKLTRVSILRTIQGE
jgi:hypothetical protein